MNAIAGQGLEPQFPGPEPDVLPLDDPAVRHRSLEGGTAGARVRRSVPWQGRPIPNGVPNRLENLLLLCPNCHSQTENFAGRGVVRPIRPVA